MDDEQRHILSNKIATIRYKCSRVLKDYDDGFMDKMSDQDKVRECIQSLRDIDKVIDETIDLMK